MLSNLPVELIKKIQYYLSRHDINQFVSTCKYIYGISLPYLYYHLELGYQSHIKQLLHGIQLETSLLKQAIKLHTKKLTLQSRQNGNNWRIQDLLRIIGSTSLINELIFFDFSHLNIKVIQQVISILPHIKHVQFKYCHIVNSQQDSFSHTTTALEHVSYVWTDFTEKSIILPSLLFKKITKLELGSNRNKYHSINGKMIQSLYQHCPNITHLTIHLPQVNHTILSNTIISYGNQLDHLSIQCDHIHVLSAIANHATQIKSLILRTTFKHSPNEEQEDSHALMAQLILECKSLSRFEIISCDMEHHVPSIIWESCLLHDYLYTRAYEALLIKATPQKVNSLSTYRPFTRQSIWFDIVDEEVLEQRSRYMDTVGLRNKSDKVSNFTNLVLHDQVLLDIRANIKKKIKKLLITI